jgi:hypothetical protein
MAFSCTGGVIREMVESGGLGGLLVFPLWLLAIVFGGILARLNGRLLETQDVETQYGKPPPLPPMRAGLPRRAAAWCAGGSALICLVLGGSMPVWAAVAPLLSGGAAWIVASRRADPRVGGMVFGAIGLLLGACCLGSGRGILPGAFLVAAAHWVGGMLVVFHARGEGAPLRRG